MREPTEGPSTAQLLRMLDHLPGMVAWWDADLRNRVANRTFTDFFGSTPERLVGRHLRDAIGARNVADAENYVASALAGERSTFERVLHDAAGEPRSTTTHYVPATVEGAPAGFYVLVSDISTRNRVEHVLEESVRQMALLEERQRIAADLHDLVIQRLFAAGLDLAAAQRGKPDAEERVARAAGAVDESIRELRGAIHSLRELMVPRQLPASIEEIIGRVARELGFVPTVTYTGSLDAVPEAVVKDLIAVVDEALGNVARRGRASAVLVVLACSEDHVVAQVVDDGEGPGHTAGLDGVDDMRARAERHGGSLSLRPHAPHGTVVEWLVPLR